MFKKSLKPKNSGYKLKIPIKIQKKLGISDKIGAPGDINNQLDSYMSSQSGNGIININTYNMLSEEDRDQFVKVINSSIEQDSVALKVSQTLKDQYNVPKGALTSKTSQDKDGIVMYDENSYPTTKSILDIID
jgi:hypothetical protein